MKVVSCDRLVLDAGADLYMSVDKENMDAVLIDSGVLKRGDVCQ